VGPELVLAVTVTEAVADLVVSATLRAMTDAGELSAAAGAV